MNDLNEELSVCLLVYNHGHTIERIITSIMEQSISNFEIVISDDCSTDDSWRIINKCASVFKNIKVLKTPSNLGMAANANFAISHARGKYIALLHHDDSLSPQILERWLEAIKLSNKVAFVFCEYNLGGGLLYHKKMGYNFLPIMNGKMFLNKYLLRNWGCPVRGTALIRKEYFDKIGGFNENFGMLADVDLWMRLSANWTVGYVNEPLIEVNQSWPDSYPKDYTGFTWRRRFILFDIHSYNINRNNYKNRSNYYLKRFVFRNRVSLEIMKWFFYALSKKRDDIIKSYPVKKNRYELFYSFFFRSLINLFKNS